MTSVAQNLANQANVQLSTGPRTHLAVRDDEREEFQSFLANPTTELQPAGALETITFDHLVHAAWTLRRCLPRRDCRSHPGSHRPLRRQS